MKTPPTGVSRPDVSRPDAFGSGGAESGFAGIGAPAAADVPEINSLNDAFGLPVTAAERRGDIAVHCLLLLLTALFAFQFSLTARQITDWSDPVSYAAAGKYMLRDRTFMPDPLSFEAFQERGAADFGRYRANYPNYAYCLLLGGLAELRGGVPTTTTGIFVSGFFTLLTALTMYAAGCRMLRSRRLALILALILVLHPLVLDMAARPYNDIILLAIFPLAVAAAVSGRHLAAGLLLGLGYLFREHALMFAPFLPLLSPLAVSPRGPRAFGLSLRGLAGAGLPLVLGFAAGPAIAWGIKSLMQTGPAAANFYVSTFSQWSESWFSAKAALNVARHLHSHFARVGPVLWLFTAFAVFAVIRRPRLLPSLSGRMLFLAVIFMLLPALLWSGLEHVPNRYAVYSLALTLFACAPVARTRLPEWLEFPARRRGPGKKEAAGEKKQPDARNRADFPQTSAPWTAPSAKTTMAGGLALLLLALPGTALYLTKTVRSNHSLLFAPLSSARSALAEIDSVPRLVRQALPPDAVVLGNQTSMPLMALERPVTVLLPESFSALMRASGNERFHGIFMRTRGTDWPNPPPDRLEDAHGVRFRRISLPDQVFSGVYLLYVRER